eukprot:TRINITY_DN9794_c1_g1_i1.p2 TRINITY_DN9794_c1_g1~~TRINITY_DN9794_c1_g1_i1.p2  ORF type:complete len:157 (+),score=42.35 TRINITY_DN9794_c1_g1_i1:427-897(+)
MLHRWISKQTKQAKISKGFLEKRLQMAVSLTERIALLTVVSTYKGPSFVENPVLYTKADGSRVTNFHDGLAKLAGTSDSERGSAAYNEAVQGALRRLEESKAAEIAEALKGKAKMCVSKDVMRMNMTFKLEEFKSMRAEADSADEEQPKKRLKEGS